MKNILDPHAIEQQLEKLFQKHKVEKQISTKEVKRWIYEEGDEDVMRSLHLFQKRFFKPFGHASESAFQEVVELCMHAWNVFPHKSLGGKSPQEMATELYGGPPPPPGPLNETIIHAGDLKLPLPEYEAFMRDLEKAQRPFRRWEKEILASYEAFLKKNFAARTAEKHLDVAGHFLSQAMMAGFSRYEDITFDFAEFHFPVWWQTHILYGNLNENQVWRSLAKFLDFVTLSTGMDLTEEE